MQRKLVDLAEPGGADRMSLAFKPARRVYRNTPTQRRLTALCRESALARRRQAERLDLNDLANRRGVMHLRDANIFWPHAGHRIGPVRRKAADMVVIIKGIARGAGLQHRRQDS